MMNRSLNRSLLFKNQESILQTEITDQWNFFQSRNLRIEISEVFEALPGNKISAEKKLKKEEWVKKRDELYEKAKSLEKEKHGLHEKAGPSTGYQAYLFMPSRSCSFLFSCCLSLYSTKVYHL